jgi:hypothetical protein
LLLVASPLLRRLLLHQPLRLLTWLRLLALLTVILRLQLRPPKLHRLPKPLQLHRLLLKVPAEPNRLLPQLLVQKPLLRPSQPSRSLNLHL